MMWVQALFIQRQQMRDRLRRCRHERCESTQGLTPCGGCRPARAPLASTAMGHGRFGRPRRRLGAGLVQLVCVLAGLGLGLLLPRVTTGPSVASTRVVDALVTVGFGTLGLVSIIFSLLFLVVQWAFGSLSPRLHLFRDDPVVWRTFGFAVGVFVFSVTAALAIGNAPRVSVIVPALEIAAVLAVVVLMRALQLRAFASIQLAPTLSAIAAEGHGILDDLYRRPCPAVPRPAVALPALRRTVIWPHGQATLQRVHLPRLLEMAGSAVIVLQAGIGDTLQRGAPVAGLHGDDATDAAVLRGLVTGQERVFGQDPLLAFRLLADIGLRALSPAVNDPATAVQVLDTIQGILSPLVTRDLDVAEVADESGTVRVVLALPSWDDYLTTSLDDLIESAARSPMVLLRARGLLTSLLDAAPQQRRPSIAWRLERAQGLMAGNFPAIWHRTELQDLLRGLRSEWNQPVISVADDAAGCLRHLGPGTWQVADRLRDDHPRVIGHLLQDLPVRELLPELADVTVEVQRPRLALTGVTECPQALAIGRGDGALERVRDALRVPARLDEPDGPRDGRRRVVGQAEGERQVEQDLGVGAALDLGEQ